MTFHPTLRPNISSLETLLPPHLKLSIFTTPPHSPPYHHNIPVCSFQYTHTTAIMGYNDVDWKAINTIRTLAVSSSSFPDYPALIARKLWLCQQQHASCDQEPSAWHHEARDNTLISLSDRCHLQGQLRPPRCANGYGSSCPRSLQQDHEVQPKEPKVAQP